MLKTIIHASKSGSVAIAATVAEWVAFVALTSVGMTPVAAQMVARIVGGVTSFGLNRQWSFSAQGSMTVQGRRFLLLYAFSYGLSVSLLWALLRLGMGSYMAKLVSDFICFGVNFIVMYAYVFRDVPGLLHRISSLWSLLDFRWRASPSQKSDS